jgi:hypothetical protein
MSPSVKFSIPALAENISRLRQAQPESACWVPEIRTGIPHECLLQILSAFQQLPADSEIRLGSLNVQQAVQLSQSPVLQQSGRPLRWLITSPISSQADAALLAQLLQSCDATVVADHFRHLELASLAAKMGGRPVGILIDVDTGQHLTGACPGPDTAALARAIPELAGIKLEGLFSALHSITTPEHLLAEQILSAVQICQHCQRMIQGSQIQCSEVFLDYVPSSVLPAFPGTGFLNSPFLIPPQSLAMHGTPIALTAEVLSRPSLDHCVVNAGSLLLRDSTEHVRVTAPGGGSVVRLFPDHAVLHLTSDAMDLRIGDQVQLWSPSLHHHSANLSDVAVLERS